MADSENPSTNEDGLDPQLAAIGESLRSIRRQQGLTLRDVEAESGGRWKAVVIGSYERGDRALTLKKAIGLASFYNVPLDQLLGIKASSFTFHGEGNPTFSLSEIRRNPEGLPPTFLRFFQEICRRRSDWNGEILSIRTSDLMSLSILLDRDEEDMKKWLRERKVLSS